MSDLDPARQPEVPACAGTHDLDTQSRVASLPALVEVLSAQGSAASAKSSEGLFTRERQVEFLHALAACGAVRGAAGRAGVSHQTAYRARLASAVFARAWDAALLAARCHAEEVLSCRAIDGVEEEVMYHGEIVATRRRYDSRLLLAHLARLDRLTADARVEAFAGDFEAALERFGEGSDAPEAAPPPEPKKTSPGQWSKRSTPAAAAKAKPVKECPECGGRCLGPEDALTQDDCQWLGNRLALMEEARPPGAKAPHKFAGYALGEVEGEQLAAFEAGEDEWWRMVPAGPDDDPGNWHFEEE